MYEVTRIKHGRARLFVNLGTRGMPDDWARLPFTVLVKVSQKGRQRRYRAPIGQSPLSPLAVILSAKGSFGLKSPED